MYMTLQQKLIALTVHLDQGFAEVLESSLFDDDAVDAGAIFTARKDFALNDEFIVCVNFFRGKNLLRFGIVRNIESRFDCRFIGSVANHRRESLSADDHAQGAHKDGFACAGFAGDGGEARAKLDLGFFDESKITDRQLF